MQNTKEEKEKFSVVMWGVAEDFGGKISREGLKVRFEALKEYSIEEIQKAGTWILKNRADKFPAVPTTKEFIDAINEVGGNPKINYKSVAELEVDKVLDFLRTKGSYATPVFDNHITQHLMGTRWRYNQWAKTVLESEFKWFRKEFIEAFVAYSEHDNAGLKIEYKNDLKKLVEKTGDLPVSGGIKIL